MSASASDVVVSHVGICVSDLARSLRFYCEGLGFAPAESHAIGGEFAAALEVPENVKLTSQFIRREGLSVELLHYQWPAPEGRPASSRNQLGLTHLSFIVPDLEAAAARLAEHGGTVLERTRTTGPGVSLLFVADPDGVRIEIMEFP
jgi:catechol 2,3-dioxygenase-like lactoylglutathione lyase family enzyme